MYCKKLSPRPQGPQEGHKNLLKSLKLAKITLFLPYSFSSIHQIFMKFCQNAKIIDVNIKSLLLTLAKLRFASPGDFSRVNILAKTLIYPPANSMVLSTAIRRYISNLSLCCLFLPRNSNLLIYPPLGRGAFHQIIYTCYANFDYIYFVICICIIYCVKIKYKETKTNFWNKLLNGLYI